MSEDRSVAEARRWLGQALHDRDAARYPNGLPAGIPHEFYDRRSQTRRSRTWKRCS